MKSPPVVRKLEVRYRDLDTLGHVNNAVYLEYFEEIRFAYWWRMAAMIGVTEFVGGDIPGAQFVIAETTVRYKAPIELTDTVFGAARVTRIGNRSYSMEYEIRSGDSFDSGTPIATGDSAQVFYDPKTSEVTPRPEWFLPTVAELEGRSEDAFLA
ncbi:putative thioesterase [Rubrobacter radiotolerans]|uniref:Putative thioesterase n=1 Tax=Rubrobacter radiotolerans TaxID=42256 RepID=A0A023WZW7_RUBRA|nr:thioesterase family protein [Rubrobacter radiotolerans]AHY45491.1 putative thioesterase [Rubrobacter radiotolerans]MDX5892902.1 thioesterase family protein [Rubrobacter radiotolerans]SMC02714.1 acyl-CoA thioester hydrolase [Rubrobacter radiotolerans DSM 5868]